MGWARGKGVAGGEGGGAGSCISASCSPAVTKRGVVQRSIELTIRGCRRCTEACRPAARAGCCCRGGCLVCPGTPAGVWAAGAGNKGKGCTCKQDSLLLTCKPCCCRSMGSIRYIPQVTFPANKPALNCSVGLPSSLEQYNASHPVTAVLNNPPQLGAMHVTEWGLLPAAAPGCVSAGAVLGVWRGSAAAVCPCSGCEGCVRGQPL